MSGERGSRRGKRGGRGEKSMVPEATFDSYYGRPIIKAPRWRRNDIAGYLFTGGLAGASSLLAAGAALTGRDRLASRSKVVAGGAIGVSAVALIHDLGRPSRFYNMLRVFKPSSPMSLGSWLLAVYGPAVGLAAATDLSGRGQRFVGPAATATAGLLGPAVAAYTAVLLGDTAVPGWHEAGRDLPFVFVASAAAAGGGMGLLVAPASEAGPARRLALLGAAGELAASAAMEQRLGGVAAAYEQGRAGRLLRLAKLSTGIGAALAVLGRGRRTINAIAGLALMAGSALTRFGVFDAGLASAEDPAFTVDPQRDRVEARSARATGDTPRR